MLQKKFFNNILLVILLLITKSVFAAADYSTVIESNTPSVLTSIESKAISEKIYKKSMGNIMQWSALQLIGKPYAAALLDKTTPEYLYISLNQTDCMLFIEEVTALSQMIKNKQSSIDDLANGIKNVRYHGEVKYCNRNHYFKDWALSNINNGIFIDEGAKLSNKYLPYDAYVLGARLTKAATHDDDLACIRARETYINQEKIGFIPMSDLPKYLSKIKAGDIIGIIRTPNGKADSVHHLGIAYLHDGKVGMIDASSIYNKVVIEDTLTGYLAKFKDSQGIVLLRAK